MYQILQYLKFLFTSTNQHGVHSPFVYDLVTQCLYDQKKHDAYSTLKAYRKALSSNTKKISITDLGAGSKRLDTQQRSIQDIAKTSGTTLKRAQLLFRIVRYLKPIAILELGTSLGIATQAMALGHKKARVTSIEGCPSVSAIAHQQLDNFQIKNTILKTGAFETHIPELKQHLWDLIFFDGNHQKGPTLQYVEQLLPTVKNNTVWIFDDIYWSKDMTEAWETIKQNPKVTITVDTFFWGLVFFRTEQTKENFKIRV